MKVKYNVKPSIGDYSQDKFFTFGAEYKVLADYRKRQSGQAIRDSGFVVIDNTGQKNMVFPKQVELIEDDEPCYTFNH